MGSPKKIEAPQYPFLVKQGSQCNLTFDDLIIRKPIINNHEYDDSVNNNVIISMQNTSPSSSSSSSSPPLFHGDYNTNHTFSTKNTDYYFNDHKSPLPPAEEFTLERFLVRTGDINAGGNYQKYFGQNNIPVPVTAKIDDDLMVSHWQNEDVFMPMPVQAMVGSNFQVLENGFENKLMDLDYLNEQIKISTVEMVAKSSDSSERMKGIIRDEVMAKTIERRRRRMIKNRESAARSRARKQAYTNQLQQNVWHLQTTNKWLNKKKEMENLLDSNSSSEPRYQLRRTSSATI